MKLHLAALALTLSPVALARPAQQTREASAPRDALAHYNLDRKKVAIEGHDPVAYFEEGGGKPRKGDAAIALDHRGVTYLFRSEKNRTLFQATPERYEPAYGGWCAYAMAKGDKVEVDPDYYRIENGQLLLFYKSFFNNTRKSWGRQGGEKLGPSADIEWTKLSGETTRRSVRPFNLNGGVALGGHDPVSYRSGKPLQGQASQALFHQGVTYHFASQENRATFLADPARFEASYGGWCAWAMAQGKQVEVNPHAFVLDGETLYLFYDASKRDEWKGSPELEPRATRAWAEFTGAN
jgi:YHS domain-containing protein